MAEQIIHRDQFKEWLPHRYENLLLDEITILPLSNKGQFKLCVTENDPLNRQLFLKEKTKGNFVFLSTSLMEVLALASILCTGKLKADEIAVFVAITQFRKEQDAKANTTLTGFAEKMSDKGGFFKYSGSLYQNDSLIASGDVMALFTQQSTSSSESKRIDIPPHEKTYKIDKGCYNKDPNMVVIDELKHSKADIAVGYYTYPSTHPFIKGHFPKTPLMMGIMQWMSIEDTLLAWAKQQQITGEHRFSLQACLIKIDGTLVADCKDIELHLYNKHHKYKDQADIIATKKITFKHMIRPTESFYIYLKHITPICLDKS